MSKGFPTSADLYTQIKHDPYVFAHNVTIGYFDARKNKLMYMPFNDWKPVDDGGDIPWHRVHEFRYKGEIMWDRAARVCTIKDIHDENIRLPKVSYGKLSLLSFNMFNEKAKGAAAFSARLEAMLALIRNAVREHDFVFLQEIPESALPVIHGLSSSAGVPCFVVSSSGTEDIVDHLAIVSRHAFTDSKSIKFSATKCFVMADVFTEDMRTLRLFNVHLTSSMQVDSASKRGVQLALLAQHTGSAHAIMAGDFNDRDILSVRGYTDLHTCMKGAEPEVYTTFDPRTNTLATGLPGPIDHVLVTSHLRPNVSDGVTPPLFAMRDVLLSDHYPLVARLELLDVIEHADAAVPSSSVSSGGAGGAIAAAAITSTAETALCIIVPYEHWNLIKSLEPHDLVAKEGAKSQRWMPHITVSLGFVPESQFFIIERHLKRVVDTFLPLRIQFTTPTVFEHGADACTVVLEVDEHSRAQLQLMRAALAELGLWKLDFSGGKRGAEYRPHLSLQRCASRDEAEKAVRKIGNSAAFSFECTKLAMVSRESSSYMLVRNTVGANQPRKDTIDRIIREHSTDIKLAGSSLLLDAKVAASNTTLAKAIAVAPTADETSTTTTTDQVSTTVAEDVDLQVLIQPPHTLEDLLRPLETCGEVLLLKRVSNPHGRYVLLQTKDANLTYDLHVKTEGVLGETGMDVVLERVESLGQRELFSACLSRIKRAMRACHVYGQKFGFIPGYGVAIMVYKMLADGRLTSQDVCVEEFASWYGRDAENALRVCNPAKSFADMSAKHMVIQNLCAPGDNVLRTVTASSVAKFKRALACGLNEALFAAKEAAEFPYTAHIVISANTLRNADAGCSLIAASFLKLVLEMQKTGDMVSHDDGFISIDSTADYPCRYALRVFTTRPIHAVLPPEAFGKLQADFYAMFEDCALELIQQR